MTEVGGRLDCWGVGGLMETGIDCVEGDGCIALMFLFLLCLLDAPPMVLSLYISSIVI